MPPRYFQTSHTDTWIRLILVSMCVMLLLPRLASPQFGLFDDGVTLTNTRQILSGEWTMAFDSNAGRFRPVYWAYNTLLAWVGGESPLVFYLGNLLLLAGAVLLIYGITRKVTGSILAAGLAGGFFLFSGPVIENTYTLSKSEPLQLVLLLAGLRLLISSIPRVTKIILGTFIFCLAYLVKETGLVMIPIFAGWVILALAGRRSSTRSDYLPTAVTGLACAAGAGILFYLSRNLYLAGGLASGTYTNSYTFTVSSLAASVVRWGGWILRDFPHLLIMAAIWIIMLLASRKVNKTWAPIAALFWMAGWVAVFLPWVYMVEYYMLPFAAGVSFFIGITLKELIQFLDIGTSRVNILAGTAAALCGLVIIPSLMNNLTAMRIQLMVDQANRDILQQATTGLVDGSQLFLNIQQESEYSKEIAIHLSQINQRSDLDVQLYQGGMLPAGAYILMPLIRNQPRMTVRLGLDETTQTVWNEGLKNTLDQQPTEEIYLVKKTFQMTGVDLPRLLCAFLQGRNYCAIPSPLFDWRTFEYGWELRRVEN